MADIITPNVKEASAFLDGVQLETVDDMRSAARLLHKMGPKLVKVIFFFLFFIFLLICNYELYNCLSPSVSLSSDSCVSTQQILLYDKCSTNS